MSIRVIPGEIGPKDTTTRTAIPTVTQARWPPFERVAETIASPRRRFPPHRHVGVEVLTYVIEGFASYEFGSTAPDPVAAGSTRLLTAPSPVSHAINPGRGQTVRWFAVVATLPAGTAAVPRLQSAVAEPTDVQLDGTVVHHLVGLGAAVTSAAGLQCQAIEFQSQGTSFLRLGHDRVAVCYAVAGHGTLDNETLDGGEAALLENASGVAMAGEPGFSVMLVTAPRMP